MRPKYYSIGQKHLGMSEIFCRDLIFLTTTPKLRPYKWKISQLFFGHQVSHNFQGHQVSHNFELLVFKDDSHKSIIVREGFLSFIIYNLLFWGFLRVFFLIIIINDELNKLIIDLFNVKTSYLQYPPFQTPLQKISTPPLQFHPLL